MEGSVKCDATAAIPTEQEYSLCWIGGSGCHRACLENFENRKFNFYHQSKHKFSVANTQVTELFELYGVPHLSLSIFLDILQGRNLLSSISYLG